MSSSAFLSHSLLSCYPLLNKFALICHPPPCRKTFAHFNFVVLLAVVVIPVVPLLVLVVAVVSGRGKDEAAGRVFNCRDN